MKNHKKENQKFINLLKEKGVSNQIIEKEGNLTIGGNLDLSDTTITELPDNLTIGGYLDLSNTAITELPDNLTIGGGLDIRNTAIKELPDNLTIGGYLDLSDTTITELPDNLTIGGYLDLSNTAITELPDNLTIGGGLDIRNTAIKELPNNTIKKIRRGYNKEQKYIYFDGILWGNVKSVKKISNRTIYKTPLGYCVEENELTAHGKTLREAMEDLTFKQLKDVNVSEIVLKIKETGKVTRSEYRAITGACSFGTNKFCQEHNIQDLEEIDIGELRKILINDYGAEKFWRLIEEN